MRQLGEPWKWGNLGDLAGQRREKQWGKLRLLGASEIKLHQYKYTYIYVYIHIFYTYVYIIYIYIYIYS